MQSYVNTFFKTFSRNFQMVERGPGWAGIPAAVELDTEIEDRRGRRRVLILSLSKDSVNPGGGLHCGTQGIAGIDS